MKFGDFDLNEEPKDVAEFVWHGTTTNLNLNGKPLTADVTVKLGGFVITELPPLPSLAELNAMYYIGSPIIQHPVIEDMIRDFEKDVFVAQINVAEEENLRFLAIVRRNNL
mgnify:CR=1 FL=1